MKKKSRPSERIASAFYSVARRLIGPVIKSIWIKNVTGLNNIPSRGPVIVALNHQSYFDFLCFASVSPRNVYFLSAEKFFTNKYWRILMKFTGQIRVDRLKSNKDEVHKAVYDCLERDEMVGIFPEGTRSPHRNEMLPAFTGAVKYAVKAQAPVVPVGIRGAFEIMSRYDKKPKFKKKIEIYIGEPISFEHYNGQELREEKYRQLTNRIMSDISQLSLKSYPQI